MVKHLMNPATGTVDTEENWQEMVPPWEWEEMDLFEVEQDDNGNWVEVERR